MFTSPYNKSYDSIVALIKLTRKLDITSNARCIDRMSGEVRLRFDHLFYAHFTYNYGKWLARRA